VAGEKRPLPALASSSVLLLSAVEVPNRVGEAAEIFILQVGGVIGWGHSRSDRSRAGKKAFFFEQMPEHVPMICLWPC
jgi:hypothetical protein